MLESRCCKCIKRKMANRVSYRLYVDAVVTSNSHASKILASRLHAVHLFAASLIQDYLWEYDGFDLSASQSAGDAARPYLHGSSCYGDNVDDEWFITYVLFEITRRFRDVTVQVCDDDGEFLLIEAANVLPKWITVENSENRVFVRHGKLCIIPPPSTPAQLADMRLPLTPDSAVDVLIHDGTGYTVAPPRVQDAIRCRINACRDDTFLSNRHYTTCLLPSAIAHALTVRPQLIAPAIRAFVLRTPSDIDAAGSMKKFLPAKESLVWASVRLTRSLYAQIVHQRYAPGKAWGQLLHPHGFTLDMLNAAVDGTSPDLSGPLKSVLIGLKISAGFEALYSRARKHPSGTDDSGRDDDAVFAKDVDAVLQSVDVPVPYDVPLIADSPDDWLNVSSQQLDSLLTARFGPEVASSASDMPASLQQFLQRQSDLTGIEDAGADPEKVSLSYDKLVRFLSAPLEHASDPADGLAAGTQQDRAAVKHWSDLTKQMDLELKQATKGPPSAGSGNSAPSTSFSASDAADPVDIDMRVVQEMLQALAQEQSMGTAGPASTLFRGFQ